MRHVTIRHRGRMPFWEGQSYGIVLPGTAREFRCPLASTRYGDDGTGKTASVLVRAGDPPFSYLSGLKAGDELQITGPHDTGSLLLAERDPRADHVMVCSEGGMAPFRAFVRRLLVESTRARFSYKGRIWLLVLQDDGGSLVYEEELRGVQEQCSNFRFNRLFPSDIGTGCVDSLGRDMFERLEGGANIYYSEINLDIMSSFENMFEMVAREKDIQFDGWIEKLKENHQWNVPK